MELRLVAGVPFAGIGFFVQGDVNTYHSYASAGLTLALGRIATFRWVAH